MSKLSDQQLDDLFKGHLMDLEKEPPVGSWSMLAKNVNQNNFLKFGWKHFNVFYLSGIIVVSLSTAIYFTVGQTSKKGDNPTFEKSILQVDTVAIESKNPKISEPVVNDQKTNTLSKKKKTIIESPSNTNSAVEQAIKDTSSVFIVPITEPATEIKTSEPEKKEVQPKAKKIITVVKRDTIRIKDTVNVERTRW